MVTALSGWRSRTSKMSRARWSRAASQAGKATTSGGDEAMTTSGLATRSAAVSAERVKPKKAHIRPR